jgi:hypothetical protein
VRTTGQDDVVSRMMTLRTMVTTARTTGKDDNNSKDDDSEDDGDNGKDNNNDGGNDDSSGGGGGGGKIDGKVSGVERSVAWLVTVFFAVGTDTFGNKSILVKILFGMSGHAE